MMGDGGSKPANAGIPAWQRAPSAAPAGSKSSTGRPAPESEETPTQTVDSKAHDESPSLRLGEDRLLEQAREFLNDESIRDASMDRKIAFLQSKGLGRADVDKAMELLKTGNDYSNSTVSSRPELPAPSSLIEHEQQPAPPPRGDVPPIITYPEFLMQAHKPPPIVTTKRLINTAYLASAAVTVVYGLSTYLINPMIDNLTAARHDFAQNAQSRIEELNERLADIVSVDLKQLGPAKNRRSDVDKASEADTDDSDPTELFHRDFGTQTSPSLTTTGTPTTRSDSESSGELPADPVHRQTFQVQSLQASCKSLMEDNATEGWATQEVTSSIDALKTYLDSLIYPSYSISSSPSGIYGNASTAEGGKKEDDQIARMRSEIRGVKGVLLSARNFPSGGRRQYWPATNSG